MVFCTKKVYKEKPPGYIDFKHPSHVYRPRKTLYGLNKLPELSFIVFALF